MAEGERGGEVSPDGLLVESEGRGLVGGFGGEQLGMGFGEAAADDVLVGDVDRAKHGLVEAAADFVGGVLVQLVRVLEQAQLRVEEPCSGGQVDRDGVTLGGEAFALLLDLPQPGFDLPGCDGAVCG
ncbi:hypothetical protein ACO0LV_15390 [Pseudactinotalea sp. Z1739]|uniref:hypothetical protein n=1 Tax=Pseudactinotalea sp. Z1739 TaxID=3413028 RepID=UPI003C7E7F68